MVKIACRTLNILYLLLRLMYGIRTLIVTWNVMLACITNGACASWGYFYNNWSLFLRYSYNTSRKFGVNNSIHLESIVWHSNFCMTLLLCLIRRHDVMPIFRLNNLHRCLSFPVKPVTSFLIQLFTPALPYINFDAWRRKNGSIAIHRVEAHFMRHLLLIYTSFHDSQFLIWKVSYISHWKI